MIKSAFVAVLSLFFSQSVFSATPGEKYLNDWMKQNPSPYTGVGIVGRAAGDETHPDAYTSFANIARRSQMAAYVRTGAELFNFLEQSSDQLGCISKITWASHGWNPKTLEGGDGIPTDVNDNGFYGNTKGRGPQAVSLQDFQYRVKKNRIRFCSRCLIQVHACNVALRFTSAMSAISGCQVINGSGRVSPVDTNNGSKDHIWTSSPISGSLCQLPDGTACDGHFIRMTPLRRGKMHFEKIGRRYVAH